MSMHNNPITEKSEIQIKDNGFDASVWNALKSSIYPGAQDESIIMVIDYCKAAGLDPLQKPVHIVPMYVNDKNTKTSIWRDIVMPGIGLYRIQASRSQNYAGVSEPEYGKEIEANLGNKLIKYPEWCKVTVRKIVQSNLVEFSAKEYWLENYAKASKDSLAPNAMWERRPYAQLAKCAEAQALRKAFPEFITHQPTAEEMEGKSLNDFELKNVTPVARQKEEIKENAANAKNLAESLMGMCKDAGLNAKEFAQFAGVSRSDLNTIENAIENFESLKETYLEVLNEAA